MQLASGVVNYSGHAVCGIASVTGVRRGSVCGGDILMGRMSDC